MNKIVNLGFGCASIMGRVDKATSLKALDFAYEHGIRYFDTARSYGWGDGEKFLGEFLRKKKREDYTITTKCGLLPQPRSSLNSFIRTVGRNVISSIPMSHNLVRGIASKSVQPSSSFELSKLKNSFYTSLSELNIEYIDTLLLHNFSLNCSNINEILDLFISLCLDGKLRKIGVSIGDNHLNEMLSLIDSTFLNDQFVLQVPATMKFSLETRYDSICRIIHSPFNISSQTEIEQNQVNAPQEDSHSLFKKYIENINPDVIVCSMFNLEHIKQNVGAINYLSKLS
jgi:aryl-alcohol dehydrogenase-like predicted oxidoreductase